MILDVVLMGWDEGRREGRRERRRGRETELNLCCEPRLWYNYWYFYIGSTGFPHTPGHETRRAAPPAP